MADAAGHPSLPGRPDDHARLPGPGGIIPCLQHREDLNTGETEFSKDGAEPGGIGPPPFRIIGDGIIATTPVKDWSGYIHRGRFLGDHEGPCAEGSSLGEGPEGIDHVQQDVPHEDVVEGRVWRQGSLELVHG